MSFASHASRSSDTALAGSFGTPLPSRYANPRRPFSVEGSESGSVVEVDAQPVIQARNAAATKRVIVAPT